MPEENEISDYCAEGQRGTLDSLPRPGLKRAYWKGREKESQKDC